MRAWSWTLRVFIPRAKLVSSHSGFHTCEFLLWSRIQVPISSSSSSRSNRNRSRQPVRRLLTCNVTSGTSRQRTHRPPTSCLLPQSSLAPEEDCSNSKVMIRWTTRSRWPSTAAVYSRRRLPSTTSSELAGTTNSVRHSGSSCDVSGWAIDNF